MWRRVDVGGRLSSARWIVWRSVVWVLLALGVALLSAGRRIVRVGVYCLSVRWRRRVTICRLTRLFPWAALGSSVRAGRRLWMVLSTVVVAGEV